MFYFITVFNDFKEFNQVIRGRKGPLFDLALKRQAKFGNKDIFILYMNTSTTRPPVFIKNRIERL